MDCFAKGRTKSTSAWMSGEAGSSRVVFGYTLQPLVQFVVAYHSIEALNPERRGGKFVFYS